MPTELGPEYSPLWKGNYPHMLDEDKPLWDKFRAENAHLFIRIFYDVRIGGVYPGPEYGTEKLRKSFYYVTAKRIDALAELKDELWLIEVATRPGLRATGQLMTYLALWLQDPALQKPVKGVLVTQNLDPDLEEAIKTYGMLVRYVI